eukprot:5182399-Pyramimonas_sp.AAC.2
MAEQYQREAARHAANPALPAPGGGGEASLSATTPGEGAQNFPPRAQSSGAALITSLSGTEGRCV